MRLAVSDKNSTFKAMYCIHFTDRSTISDTRGLHVTRPQGSRESVVRTTVKVNKCKKITSLKLFARTVWWYHSTKTAEIFWGTLDGAMHGASISCSVHRVTQKIFAVLVEWYHHIAFTMSFKLVSFYIYICCFTAEGRGMRTGQQCWLCDSKQSIS